MPRLHLSAAIVQVALGMLNCSSGTRSNNAGRSPASTHQEPRRRSRHLGHARGQLRADAPGGQKANGAKLNQVVYWSQPVNWKNQTLTPNPDTIYLNPFYDTTRRPGRARDSAGRRPTTSIVGSFDVAWQNALAMSAPPARTRARAASTSSCRRATRKKCPTATSCCRRRLPRLRHPALELQEPQRRRHRQSAVAHGKRVKIYPLSAAIPIRPCSSTSTTSRSTATIPYDATFFERSTASCRPSPG